jgi:hypothetical protein
MTFLRKSAKYTLLDYKRNEGIVEELKIQPVIEKKFRITITNGYNTFTEFTGLDTHTLS